MTQYGFIVDVTKCMECGLCTTACKDEFVGNDWPPYSAAQPDTQYGYYRAAGGWFPGSGTPQGSAWVTPGQNWINVVESVIGTYPHAHSKYVPQPCMQCSNAPCIAASTGGAAYTRPDGIVIFDPTKSVGQTKIQPACPYGVVFWNSNTNLPQKCTFCAHRIDSGMNPKCVDVCPVSAITFGDLSNSSSTISQLLKSSGAMPLHPEFGTKPNVYYIGLPTPFLSGTVVDANSKQYLQGATVTLTDSSGKSVSNTVDNYGVFEFDNLVASATYQLQIQMTGHTTKTMTATANNTDLGEIGI